jgi:hypothetical protein
MIFSNGKSNVTACSAKNWRKEMCKSLPMCDGRSPARTETNEILDSVRQGNRRALERVTPRENSQSVVAATLVVAGLWVVGAHVALFPLCCAPRLRVEVDHRETPRLGNGPGPLGAPPGGPWLVSRSGHCRAADTTIKYWCPRRFGGLKWEPSSPASVGLFFGATFV